MRTPLIVLALFASAAPAFSADLAVSLKTPSGQPVSGAVVTFHPVAGAGRAAAAGAYAVTQQNIRFDPGVLVVPVGAEVRFPNKDKVRHHVYSFSPARKFELKLYGRDESHTVRFDKPGVVALGCNIHDAMSGHVVVVDTPHVARSSGGGEVVLSGLPNGAGKLTVWHPRLKNPNVGVVRTLPAAAGRHALVLDLRGG